MCQKSPLGHRFGRRHGHHFFSSPRKKICSPKKSRRAFGASATLARRRLSNNKAKFESRTGQNVADASAASNTERAIETGGRAAAERLLGAARQQRDGAIELKQQKKAEKEASEKTREREAEKGEHVISFPLVPRALAEWAHEECPGHPCSNSDVEDMQDTPWTSSIDPSVSEVIELSSSDCVTR